MIKIIAMVSMLLDHIGEVFFPNTDILIVIGRLAFPLFAWGIAKGLKRTHNFNKYAIRLLFIAIISQYPHDLLFKSDYSNVCFTLLDGLIVLKLYESKVKYYFKILGILGLFTIAHSILNFEYGIYGIALIVVFYIFEGKYYLIFLQTVITIMGVLLYHFSPVQFVSLLAILIIDLLQKYDFKINKIIGYGFYPIHLLLLLGIKQIM